MSIAEMIMGGTQQQSNNWSVLSENLGRLGQQVGNQLAMREYQKQAAEALPAMQAAYRSAMDDVSRGSVSEGYKKFIDAQFQFGGSQNPFISNQNKLVSEIFMEGAAAYEKQQQRKAQYGGGGGGTSGGGADGGYYDVESALGLPTSEDIQTPTGDVPTSEGTELEVQYADEQPAQNYTANLLTLANSATPKFKDFLTSVAKNPPPQERVQQATQYNKEYEATPEDQKAAYRQGVSIVVPSKKEIGEIKNKYGEFFFEFDSDQKKIVGDGIEGVVLSPAQVIKSVTEGSKGLSRTSGTNLEDLMTYKKGIDGSLEQLGDEKLKKFLAKNGGIFNVGFKQEGKKKIVNADGNEEEVPDKITLFPKSIDPEKLSPEARGKYEIEITPTQLAAFQSIKGMPGEMNRLRAQKSDSSLVRIGAQGPTAPKAPAAAPATGGLPAVQAQAPAAAAPEIPDVEGNPFAEKVKKIKTKETEEQKKVTTDEISRVVETTSRLQQALEGLAKGEYPEVMDYLPRAKKTALQSSSIDALKNEYNVLANLKPAIEWLKKNPNHKDAPAAAEVIRKKLGI